MATLFDAVWQVAGVLRSCDMCFVYAIIKGGVLPQRALRAYYHQNTGYLLRAARLLAARASTSMHVAPAAQGSRTYQ